MEFSAFQTIYTEGPILCFFLISNLSQTDTFGKYNKNNQKENESKIHKDIQTTNPYSLLLYLDINLSSIKS